MDAAKAVETQTRQTRRRLSVTNSLERVRHLQTSHQLDRQQTSRGAEHDAARRTFIQRKGRALRTQQHALFGAPTVQSFSPDSVSPSSTGTSGVSATYPADPPNIIPESLRRWTLDSTPDLGQSLSRARRRRPEQLTFVLPGSGSRRPPLRRMQSRNSTNPRSIQYRLEVPTSPSPIQHNISANPGEDVTDKVAAFLEKACVLAETDRDPSAERTSNIEERIKKYETRKRQMQRRTSLVYCPGSVPMDGPAVGSMKRISVVAPPTESTIDETDDSDSSSEESELSGETRTERLDRLRALPPLLLPPIYTVRTRQPARQIRSWPPPKPRVPRRISQRVWDELKECRYIRQKTGAGNS